MKLTQEELVKIATTNKSRIERLLDLGVLFDENTAKVRGQNAGKSNYANFLIQAWAIWMEYNLDPWTADVVKRCLRTKEEGGMTLNESKLLDWTKIKHIASEMERQFSIKVREEKEELKNQQKDGNGNV